jgi:hypothetical protein
MARNPSRIRLEHYPLPPAEGTRLCQLLDLAPGASAVDPCAGSYAAASARSPRKQGPTPTLARSRSITFLSVALRIPTSYSAQLAASQQHES